MNMHQVVEMDLIYHAVQKSKGNKILREFFFTFWWWGTTINSLGIAVYTGQDSGFLFFLKTPPTILSLFQRLHYSFWMSPADFHNCHQSPLKRNSEDIHGPGFFALDDCKMHCLENRNKNKNPPCSFIEQLF